MNKALQAALKWTVIQRCSWSCSVGDKQTLVSIMVMTVIWERKHLGFSPCSCISILNHFSRTARDKSSFTPLYKFSYQNHSRTKLTMFVEVTVKLIVLYKTLKWFMKFKISVQVLYWLFLIHQVLQGNLIVLSWLQTVCSFNVWFT